MAHDMTHDTQQHQLEQSLSQPTYTHQERGAAISVVALPGEASQVVSQAQATGKAIQLARVVSTIGHPFLVAPLAIVLLIWLDQGNLGAALGWAGLCAGFVVLPGIIYLRHKVRRHRYSDADVSIREHRYGYYLFGLACMALCFATLIRVQAPPVLLAAFTAAIAALVVAAIANRVWTKVSIHTGTMAGVATATAFFSWPMAVIFGLGTIVVGWARLKTGRHTLIQALSGALIAVVCVSAVLSLWLYLPLS